MPDNFSITATSSKTAVTPLPLGGDKGSRGGNKFYALCAFLIFIILLSPSTNAASWSEKKIKKTSNEIKELDANINKLNEEVFTLQKELAAMARRENNLRETLITDLKKFEHDTVTLVRIARLPQPILGITSDARAPALTHAALKNARAQMDDKREELAGIFTLTGEHHTRLQELSNLQQKVSKQRKKLARTRQGLLNGVAKKSKRKAKLLEQSYAIGDAPDIRNAIKNLKTSYQPPVPARSYGELPLSGTITQRFGNKVNGIAAQGLTIRTSAGEDIRTIRDGQIVYAGPFREYGTLVIVDHGNNFFSLYGHLDKALPYKVGDLVAAGTPIGHAPKSKEPEIYLEVRRKDKPVNPLTALK